MTVTEHTNRKSTALPYFLLLTRDENCLLENCTCILTPDTPAIYGNENRSIKKMCCSATVFLSIPAGFLKEAAMSIKILGMNRLSKHPNGPSNREIRTTRDKENFLGTYWDLNIKTRKHRCDIYESNNCRYAAFEYRSHPVALLHKVDFRFKKYDFIQEHSNTSEIDF